MVLAIFALIFSVVTLLIGYLIEYQQMVGIIADYDAQKVTDKEEFAKWVGSNLILLGTVGFLIGIAGFFTPGTSKILVLFFVGILIVIAGRISMGCEKFEK